MRICRKKTKFADAAVEWLWPVGTVCAGISAVLMTLHGACLLGALNAVTALFMLKIWQESKWMEKLA